MGTFSSSQKGAILKESRQSPNFLVTRTANCCKKCATEGWGMKISRIRWHIILAICLLGVGRTLATTFEEVESTYLGDGWFKYRMKQFRDPYFIEEDITEFAVGF